MPYFQRVQLMGVIGSPPEYKSLPTGPLCRFSVCVDEWYRSRQPGAEGTKKKITTWFRCSAFGKTAEQAVKILDTGLPVFVEGKLRTRKNEAGLEFWSITVDTFRSLKPTERRTEPEDNDIPEGVDHG